MKKLLFLVSLMMLTACSTSSKYDQLIADRYQDDDVKNIKITDSDPSTLKKVIQTGDYYFLVFETTGFHDGLVIGVEIEKNNLVISDVSIVEHQETPDYGGVVDQGWFTKRYLNQTINTQTKVVQWISKSEDEIVAMTGATITSNAINTVINQAKQYTKEIGE